jgi:hypothetical protein
MDMSTLLAEQFAAVPVGTAPFWALPPFSEAVSGAMFRPFRVTAWNALLRHCNTLYRAPNAPQLSINNALIAQHIPATLLAEKELEGSLV